MKQAQSSRLVHLQLTRPLVGDRKLCLIRAKIASGFYDRPDVIGAIVEALLAEICSPEQN